MLPSIVNISGEQPPPPSGVASQIVSDDADVDVVRYPCRLDPGLLCRVGQESGFQELEKNGCQGVIEEYWADIACRDEKGKWE